MTKAAKLSELERVVAKRKAENMEHDHRLKAMEEHLEYADKKAARLGHLKKKEEEASQSSGNFDDQDDQDPPISVWECIKQLRTAGEPITLFNESKMQRYRRLQQIQVDSLDNEYRKSGKRANPRQEEDVEDVKIDDEDSPISQIMDWIRDCLQSWEGASQARNEEPKDQFLSTKKELKSLMQALRMNEISAVLVEKLHTLFKCVHDKDLQGANTIYMDIAIGKQAWPVGVQGAIAHPRASDHMVAPKENLFDDERSKLWLLAIKRLLSFVETRKI